MSDDSGAGSDAIWERLAEAIHAETVRVGQLEAYQAYRAGFHAGGLIAMNDLRRMIAAGLSVEQALEGLRDFWSHQIHPWAEGPTYPGQELLPASDLGRRRGDE